MTKPFIVPGYAEDVYIHIIFIRKISSKTKNKIRTQNQTYLSTDRWNSRWRTMRSNLKCLN